MLKLAVTCLVASLVISQILARPSLTEEEEVKQLSLRQNLESIETSVSGDPLPREKRSACDQQESCGEKRKKSKKCKSCNCEEEEEDSCSDDDHESRRNRRRHRKNECSDDHATTETVETVPAGEAPVDVESGTSD